VTTLIERRLSPEEEELAKKRQELAELQVQLADRELSFASRRAELAAFEGKYLRRVGVLYAELDEYNAKIAELMAKEVGTEEHRATATQARAQAAESYAASHGEAAEAKDLPIPAELKSLYRDVAKRVHPDLSVDEADRKQREHLMTEANRVYQNADADSLRRILQEYADSPDSVRGTGVAADLVRVLRQLKQVRNRLAQIEEEMALLEGSAVAILKTQADDASRQGRDLLAEMATKIQGQINSAREHYKAVSRA